MKKSDFLNIILFIHIVASLTGLLILMFFPFDRIKWNIGCVISWLILITAIVLTFSIPKDFRYRKHLKTYVSVFWGVPVIGFVASIFVWIFGMVYITIICNMFIPQSPLFQNKDYTIRREASPMMIKYDVYRKERFIEKRIGTLDSELILDTDQLKSFRYNVDINQGMLEYTDTMYIFELSCY